MELGSHLVFSGWKKGERFELSFGAIVCIVGCLGLQQECRVVLSLGWGATTY